MFNCSYCSYISNKKSNITRHIKNKHTTNKEEINEQKETDKEQEINTDDIYTCDKCSKKYKTKKHYINHYKTCIGVNVLTCPRCMFEFTTAQAKSKHIKKDNCKPRSTLYANNTNPFNNTINNITNNTTNNTINNNITNNIYINDFKNERTDYITLADIIRIIKENTQSISKYVELKHFNEKFPENCNIKFLKHNSCIVKKDNDWTLQTLDDITHKLYNINYKEVCKKINSEKDNIEKKQYEITLETLGYLDLAVNKKHNIDFIKKLVKRHKAENTNVNNYETSI